MICSGHNCPTNNCRSPDTKKTSNNANNCWMCCCLRCCLPSLYFVNVEEQRQHQINNELNEKDNHVQKLEKEIQELKITKQQQEKQLQEQNAELKYIRETQ